MQDEGGAKVQIHRCRFRFTRVEEGREMWFSIGGQSGFEMETERRETTMMMDGWVDCLGPARRVWCVHAAAGRSVGV